MGRPVRHIKGGHGTTEEVCFAWIFRALFFIRRYPISFHLNPRL